MRHQVTRWGLRLWLLILTTGLWAGWVAAQDETEAADSANTFGPMFAVLLLGILVILALGFAMNRRDSPDGGNTSV